LSGPSHLVLYDGVCGLCNALVRFVIARDPGGRFRFAALDSRAAREAIARHGVAAGADTVVLIVDYGSPGERAWLRFRAARAVARELGGIWALLARLAGLVPVSLGDRLYDFVACRRYRWFGRLDACPAPGPGARDRFLD
jgi:predicted DCC family thiol-disulfide oxidoreductase YuxK